MKDMYSESEMAANIGFFEIDYSTGGGVERVTANLMHQFYNTGFKNLHLISLKSDMKEPVMKYPEVRSLKILSSGKKNFSNELCNFLLEKNIRHLIFQSDNMTIALNVLKAAKAAKCKAYPQYHGSPYAYLKKYSDAEKINSEKKLLANIVFPFKKNKLKKLISNSEEGFFCVSEGSAQELREIFKNDQQIIENLKVIRNPILLEDYKPVEKEKKISFVSRLERKHKNAFLAVKAWALICDKFPDWTLQILGDGSLKGKMEKFATENNIKNIAFKGFVYDVNSELAKSSISLCVSNCEGFNMAVAEAIVQRNAIVSTDSDGGVKDMLIHNQTALVSPKNDEKVLAENISKLIENPVKQESLRNEAFKNLQKISSENAASQWLQVLFG